MSVFRVYVEKKEQFAVEAGKILADIRTALGIDHLQSVRLLQRYDVEGLDAAYALIVQASLAIHV